MRIATVLAALLVALVSQASAADKVGYGPWRFGMTRDEVRSSQAHGPYYTFRNNDHGTQGGDFEGYRVPISFGFRDDRLWKILILLYQDGDYESAVAALERAFRHIERTFGATEVPALGLGPRSLSDAINMASSLREAPTGKVQIGAVPMPKEVVVYSSLFKQADGQYWVFLYYEEP